MPSGAYGYDVNGVQLDAGTPIPNSLALIAGAVQGQTGSGGGGGIPVTPASATQNPQNLGASAQLVIPPGAKEWTVVCITGTLTIAGAGTTSASALPAGLSDSSSLPLVNAITVTTASASSAYVRWAT